MAKTLFIIGAGIESIPGIKTAREMGMRVVVSDIDPQAPGLSVADEYFLADTYDIEGTIAEARRYHETRSRINGVMCIASDIPLTVASVAADLGLPGISLKSATLAMDKLAMKDAFAADNVPIPWYNPVESTAHLFELIKKNNLPLVIKPVDSRGARGVLQLTQAVDIAWAFDYAKGFSPTGRVMVEKFLSGPQVSTESIVIDGKIHTPGFSDRNYELLAEYFPNIIENGGDMPSNLARESQKNIRDLVASAANSLGIVNGVVKGDIVVNDGKPYVIELAARLSGGYFCSHQIVLNTGVDLVKAAITQALGGRPDAVDLCPIRNDGVSQRFIFPEPGEVVAIENVEEVAARPEIALLEIRTAIGDIVGSVDSHPARAGLVIATGKSRTEATANAIKAIADIKIITSSQKP